MGVPEQRYLGLVEIARTVAEAADWKHLAAAVSNGLERAQGIPAEAPGVRVWIATAEGYDEVARHPVYHDFSYCPSRDLERAARAHEPVRRSTQSTLLGLGVGGAPMGVVEVEQAEPDAELLLHAMPVIASRVSALAVRGIDGVLPASHATGLSQHAAMLMSTFAAEVQRQLSHDRLSAYLLTCGGRAFERFAVATSPLIPGEGTILPVDDVGLGEVITTNRALICADFLTDPRLSGREDRMISAAGFRGLLSVPLRLGGQPIGVLNFSSRTPGYYHEDDVVVAQQIADQVAGFVGHLYLQQRMRTLVRHEATEHERSRVGRDLYHAVAHSLPMIAEQSADLSLRLRDDDPGAGAEAERLGELAQRTLADVRRSVVDLAPLDLDVGTFEQAADALLDSLSGEGVSTRLDLEGEPWTMPSAVRRGAYRILQEALANVRKHALARSVQVRIVWGESFVLTVDDDGIGFDAASASGGGGLGLRHMLERALAVGGVLSVERGEGGGTRVRFEVPDLDGLGTESLAPPADELGYILPTPSLRVFVIEPHAVMRAGLVRLAQSSPGVRVIGEASSIENARQPIRRSRPDAVLVDGEVDAGELARFVGDLRMALPRVRIVVAYDTAAPRRSSAVPGTASYVKKTGDGGSLAAVLRAPASDAQPLVDARSASDRDTLTEREIAILDLVAAGRTNAEIGQTLFLATKTVERQVATVVQKLGARNRTHAASLAVSLRLVDLETA
jgi:signal transduction histidine kinase/DNA-binding NarL/FixJ family response regulator